MFIVDNYSLAVIFCLITMLCWGSWGNTQKLAGKTWRYELFYWDYVIGILLFAVLMAFTLGSFGNMGRGFVADLRQADVSNLLSAVVGGVIFNASNILLAASTSIAGMAVAFPLGVGLALVLGVFINYFGAPKGDPVMLFAGVSLIVVAIVFNGIAASMKSVDEKNRNARKGILLAAVAGVLMAFFYRFVAAGMDLDNFVSPAAGKMTPYTAFFLFACGIFLSNIIFNTIVMKKPFVGAPVAYRTYFSGSARTHGVGILGGCIWGLGTLFSYIAAGKAGAAVSYALGQGAPMIAAIWGIFIWKEFEGAARKVRIFLWFMFILFIGGLGLIVAAGASDNDTGQTPAPIAVIFDTDMGNDIDDALALDMLYKYMDDGRIDLLAIPSTKTGEYATAYIDVMNTWYGYPDIPIGTVRSDSPAGSEHFTQAVCEMQDADGIPLFNRTVMDGDVYRESVRLYREVLAAQADSSVIVISVGFFTNLAQLIDTPADDISPLTGRELVARKVKLVSAMMGDFSGKDYVEFNIKGNLAAARKFIEEWPTQIVVSPFELGSKILFPGSCIEDSLSRETPNPLFEGYKNYLQMPYDRQTWDLTSTLWAIEPDSAYFRVSKPGTIEISDVGVTRFIPDPKGKHGLLTVTDEQIPRIRERMVELVMRRPAGR